MAKVTGSDLGGAPPAWSPAGCARHTPQACDAALSSAFRFLGKRWTGVVLATLMNGAAGFADLKRVIAGISDSMLSERLVELAEAGLVSRSVEGGPPIAVRYALTPAGLALLPAMNELSAWAAANLAGDKTSGGGGGRAC